MTATPALFGLNQSNRDFTNPESWGKNSFNSSFPAALICYMGNKNIDPVYIKIKSNLKLNHGKIKVNEILGLEPMSPHLYFAFETGFSPFLPFVVGNIPRIDLVTINAADKKSECLRALEIKLTALPDHQTCDLKENKYGSEIVVRPDSIVYLALSIANEFQSKRAMLYKYFEKIIERRINWENIGKVKSILPKMVKTLDKFISENIDMQVPFMIQPIWKTEGKYLRLHKNCFDAFIWTNFAFTRLFIDSTKLHLKADNITRHTRTTVWMTKMLCDFAQNGKINFKWVIDHMTYNTKNDKAFASGGIITHPYMKCRELEKPRIRREAVKDIILGGGEKYLSPERRLDAAILSTSGLF